MRDGDEDKEELSGEGARKMLGGYEVCNRVDGECHTKVTLEQKPKEVRGQILWLSGEKTFCLARDRIMLRTFEKSQEGHSG